MGKRSTADIVVIILAVMVFTVVFLMVIGILIIKLFHPASEHALATEAILGMLKTVIGALVGFVSGRVYESYKNGNNENSN